MYVFDSAKMKQAVRDGILKRSFKNKTEQIEYINSFLSNHVKKLSVRKTTKDEMEQMYLHFREEYREYRIYSNYHWKRHWEHIFEIQREFIANEFQRQLTIELERNLGYLTYNSIYEEFGLGFRVVHRHPISNDSFPYVFHIHLYMPILENQTIDAEFYISSHQQNTIFEQYKQFTQNYIKNMHQYINDSKRVGFIDQKKWEDSLCVSMCTHMKILNIINESIKKSINLGNSIGLIWGEWDLKPIEYEEI